MNFNTLPKLGQPLENGLFAGVTTLPDGTHSAITLLPGNGTNLNWQEALAWAEAQGGELPSSSVGALLFANLKDTLPSSWYWGSKGYEASSPPWDYYFTNGHISNLLKFYKGYAVAVRLGPLTA